MSMSCFLSQISLVTVLLLIPSAASIQAAPNKKVTPHSVAAANAGHQNVVHNTAHKNQAHAANAANNAAKSAVVNQLRAAHALLVQADHDYQGHRAKAAHEVSQAIHELTGAHHNGNGQAVGKNQQAGGKGAVKNQQAGNQGGNANPKMPQAQSDALLHKAAQMLSTSVGSLPGGHKSTTHVHAAISELGTALKIK